MDPDQLASLGSTVFKSMNLVSQVHYRVVVFKQNYT